jgi:ABC-type multidrug transport system fused ATPase/permease subunit
MGDFEGNNKKRNGNRKHRDQVNLDSHPVVGSDRLLDVNEEMAADFAINQPVVHAERREERTVDRDEPERAVSGGYALGWVSLVFAIASWFIWPLLMGVTSVVLGFIAFRQGARGLGGWSMTIGLIAVALNLVIVPLYYALT